MPCDSRPVTPIILERRITALDRLQRALAMGSVKVNIGRNGALAFTGWAQDDREGLSDLCAYRKLAARNAPELRRAIARAEAVAGVKLNERAVAAGVHSHDGGATWHSGH